MVFMHVNHKDSSKYIKIQSNLRQKRPPLKMHSRFLLVLSITVFAFYQACLARPTTKKSNDTSTDAASSAPIKKGKHFDRVVIIVMENQDYDVAYKDKFLQGLNKEYGNGIMLTNYLATTHPSQPNYVSDQVYHQTSCSTDCFL